jgi:muramoyltetrapeptide carboxypeptidase
MIPLTLLSPSGAVPRKASLQRAVQRLQALDFAVDVDAAALARQQRFAGDDATRLQALHRVAEQAPSVAMATRGGYGLTPLLDAVDWALLARAAERGTRWVGHSDFTALQIGLWAHTGATSWAGPMALADFGRTAAEGGVDDVTAGCFAEAMRGELEAVGFRTAPGLDGLQLRGPLWGGNLAMLCSLLGTPHFPRAARMRGGLLFIEDTNEHPYRVERMLLQLAQCGVLATQAALLVGDLGGWKRSPLDRGYGVAAMLQRVQAHVQRPILTGLPFGHVPTKVSLPVGRRVTLAVQGQQALIGW